MKNSATANAQDGMISASRREFLKRSTTAVAGSLVTGLSIAHSAHVAGSDVIRVGLVGCGGRGTGAATQVLNADRGARLVAMSDAFNDRLQTSLRSMKQQENIRDRVLVDSDHQFTGFDANLDTWDGIHPNGSGAYKMADKWFEALQDHYCIEPDGGV